MSDYLDLEDGEAVENNEDACKIIILKQKWNASLMLTHFLPLNAQV